MVRVQNPGLILTWEKLCHKDWRWTLSVLLGRVLEAVSNRLAGFHYQGTGIPGFLQTLKRKTVNLQESLRLDTRKLGLDGIGGGGRVGSLQSRLCYISLLPPLAPDSAFQCRNQRAP